MNDQQIREQLIPEQPTDLLPEDDVTYALDRALFGPAQIQGTTYDFGKRIVRALLLAGVPIYDQEVPPESLKRAGAMLVPGVAGSFSVVWRQHWAMDISKITDAGSALWRIQQSAMHDALHMILEAQGFWMEDGADGSAPTVKALNRPDAGQASAA